MPTKKPPNFAAWRRVLIPKKPNVKTIFVKGAGLEPATVYDPMGSHSNQLSYPLKNRAATSVKKAARVVCFFKDAVTKIVRYWLISIFFAVLVFTGCVVLHF